MKKKLFAFMALAATLAATSCQSDEELLQEDPQEPTNGTSTTGTAPATINGTTVDVKWIQLWKKGPKFAEYNVGVTDDKAESYGGYYKWENNIATQSWGSNWRMPIRVELQALLALCDVAWTTVNGVNGLKFTGKGDYSSNSVFLPAAGDCDFGNVFDQGNCGDYWSSTPAGSEPAYRLRFRSDYQRVYDSLRDIGYSVRAVLKED